MRKKFWRVLWALTGPFRRKKAWCSTAHFHKCFAAFSLCSLFIQAENVKLVEKYWNIEWTDRKTKVCSCSRPSSSSSTTITDNFFFLKSSFVILGLEIDKNEFLRRVMKEIIEITRKKGQSSDGFQKRGFQWGWDPTSIHSCLSPKEHEWKNKIKHGIHRNKQVNGEWIENLLIRCACRHRTFPATWPCSSNSARPALDYSPSFSCIPQSTWFPFLPSARARNGTRWRRPGCARKRHSPRVPLQRKIINQLNAPINNDQIQVDNLHWRTLAASCTVVSRGHSSRPDWMSSFSCKKNWYLRHDQRLNQIESSRNSSEHVTLSILLAECWARKNKTWLAGAGCTAARLGAEKRPIS